MTEMNNNQFDAFIDPLSKELGKWIQRKSVFFSANTLKFNQKVYEQIAVFTIEFGQDVHNDLGIWSAYEAINQRIFGTPLPVHGELYELDSQNPFDVIKVQHFLWKIIGELIPNVLISPIDPDLENLAETVSNFLSDKLKRIPKDSFRKQFLTNPVSEAGDMKKKLIWLGTESYMFRLSYFGYLHKNKLEDNVNAIDDFICTKQSRWSGINPVEMLAEVLDLSSNLKTDLLSWKERVQGMFKVLDMDNDTITMLNLFNQVTYKVLTPEAPKYFGKTKTVHGWIIPWDGKWYWSGQQRTYKDFAENELTEFVNSFLARNPIIQYQRDDKKLTQAQNALETIFRESLDYFKTDLGYFANGTDMAAQLKAKDMAVRLKKDPNAGQDIPEYSFPDYIQNYEKEIGYFLNPKEGIELFLGFKDLVTGLDKTTEELSSEEAESFFHFMTSDNISPDFVNRVIKEHSAKKLLELFFLEELDTEQGLKYLIRCYKGNYFQKRYPNIALTE